MQLKSDLIHSLKAYGRLPQPSLEDYFNELAMNGSAATTEAGASKIQLAKLRKDLADTQDARGRLHKERE